MNFRLNSSQLFLTYPQCNATKEQLRDFLLVKLAANKPIEWVVAHELHANGDHHLHAYIKMEKKVDFKGNPQCLDFMGFHGNYQGCRSRKNVMKYVSKEDDYITNIDLSDLNGKKNAKVEVAERVIKGEELKDLIEEFPQFLFGYKRLKEDVLEYKRDIGDKRLSLPNWLPNPWGYILPTKVHSKRRHYWIFSRTPNKGKTYHFALPLEREYRCLLQVGDFTYWNIRGDEELLILDEYNTAKLGWAQLNSMADGTFVFRVFQGGCRRMGNAYIVIVLSNQSISELYPHMNQFLYERFKEIEIV